MEKNDSELFNTIYKEISEELGIDVALKIFQMYKGTQISFPIRLFNIGTLGDVYFLSAFVDAV